MEINRISPVTGQINTRNINITHEQLWEWENGELIQVVAPELTPDDREFLISGILPDEWSLLYPLNE